MLLLLTKSTLYWLNLTWDASTPRNNTALAGRVKNWANFVATVGNMGHLKVLCPPICQPMCLIHHPLQSHL